MPSVQMPAGQQLWRHGAKRALQAAETQSLHALVIRVPVVPHAREEEHRLARTLLCRQSYFPRSHSRRGLGLQHSRHQSWIQAGNVGLRGGRFGLLLGALIAYRMSQCAQQDREADFASSTIEAGAISSMRQVQTHSPTAVLHFHLPPSGLFRASCDRSLQEYSWDSCAGWCYCCLCRNRYGYRRHDCTWQA